MHVLLAVKDPDLRVALELRLHEEPNLTIFGAASETEGLKALVRTSGPDMLVVDWDLPGQPMAEALADVAAGSSSPLVIVLGHDAEDRAVALAAGAAAYVVKGERPEYLQAALDQVLASRRPGQVIP